ncbi:MAG: Cytosolic Fe-S cluster assembly factor nar1 [Stictis urceolatum]|nr:Cytosolic Fe-S cluster assembly factor nar1 [Stictis urceolata]
MSAILSADDLNDFISPGVACIKPVETLPLQAPADNEYEVTTEDKVAAQAPPAQISLTDCLACSGCVTSAEAVLVSLQSHSEALSALDSAPMISPVHLRNDTQSQINGQTISKGRESEELGKIFVASVSPQVRASIAATYGTTKKEAGWMIEQLFSGTQGLGTGGKYGNHFAWVVDINAMREACLVLEADDLTRSVTNETVSKKPMLTSACPGWVCYAEKTHAHMIPHLSETKSPQALTGTMLKTVLSKKLGVKHSQIWHLAVMPCFDKKLEASRAELTDTYWEATYENAKLQPGASRDVDCVITAREILMLAESRGISFPLLPREPLDTALRVPFPDKIIEKYLFKGRNNSKNKNNDNVAIGSSGGFLYHILCTQQALYPGSTIISERGRNADVVDFKIMQGNSVVFKAARYYGFRNIQNLVRKLKPARQSRLLGGKMVGARRPNAKSVQPDNAYVEVMACPGGCTNGGGQIKVDDLSELQAADRGIANQKEWLAAIDETYYSMDEESNSTNQGMPDGAELINGIDVTEVKSVLEHWSKLVGINLQPLTHTTFRAVESDVGKPVGGTEHVVEIASRSGGGW